MREIKFRVWDKFIDGWCKPEEIGIRADGLFLFEDYDSGCGSFWNTHALHEERFIACQYTGLHDKNGKEIYEGDVLKVRRYHVDFGAHHEVRTVVFASGMFVFDKDNDGTAITGNDFRSGELEIIGNIYEHHELVNK